jgi:hypothetical protein
VPGSGGDEHGVVVGNSDLKIHIVAAVSQPYDSPARSILRIDRDAGGPRAYILARFRLMSVSCKCVPVHRARRKASFCFAALFMSSTRGARPVIPQDIVGVRRVLIGQFRSPFHQ